MFSTFQNQMLKSFFFIFFSLSLNKEKRDNIVNDKKKNLN